MRLDRHFFWIFVKECRVREKSILRNLFKVWHSRVSPGGIITCNVNLKTPFKIYLGITIKDV